MVGDDVTVEERGNNTVVINNNGGENVTATVEGQLFTFNTTVSPEHEMLVPANSTKRVTIHE